jgi:hypothetical protein
MEYLLITLGFLIYFVSLAIYLVTLIKEYNDFEGKMENYNRTMYFILGITSFIPVINTGISIAILKEKQREK